MNIADYLSTGRANAKKKRELMSLTGLTEKQVRDKIQQERKSGVPILSTTLDGYFLPENEHDTKIFIRSMRHRANEIVLAANGVENGQQQSLF